MGNGGRRAVGAEGRVPPGSASVMSWFIILYSGPDSVAANTALSSPIAAASSNADNVDRTLLDAINIYIITINLDILIVYGLSVAWPVQQHYK